MTFKTMLAGNAEDADLNQTWLVSPKLDGVRCHIINGVAVSRNLKAFKNPAIQRMFGHKKYDGLDGELMIGDPADKDAFRKTGVINSHNGDVSQAVFYVFDDFSHPTSSFDRRLGEARERVAKSKSGLKLVEHTLVRDTDRLLELEAQYLAAGYEGLMLRDPAGPYKYGRSTAREGWLLKLKRFEDSEAVIDGVEELMHNANEKTLERSGKAVRNSHKAGMVGRATLGALQVRDIHTGVAFSIGSGFTDAERQELWADSFAGGLVGRVVKYRFFPTGGKTKPRFPTFLGFRDPDDT